MFMCMSWCDVASRAIGPKHITNFMKDADSMIFLGEIQETDVQSKEVPLQWHNHLRQSLEEGCQKAVLGMHSPVLLVLLPVSWRGWWQALCMHFADTRCLQEPAGRRPHRERSLENLVRQPAGAESVPHHRTLLQGPGPACCKPHQTASGMCVHLHTFWHTCSVFWVDVFWMKERS